MTRKKIIIKNTLSNIGMQLISAGLPFILLPFMLRYWGKETYGILILAYSIQTFMYFLNGAISLTLMKYVSEVNELEDFKRLNAIINDFWLIAFLNNLLVSMALLLIASFGLRWLNIPEPMIDRAQKVFLIMGITGIVSGLFSFIDGVMFGLQKIHENNLFRMTEAIFLAIIAVSVLYFQQTLIFYVAAISSFPILVRGVQFIYLKKVLPAFELNPFKHFDFGELKLLSKFSGYQIANQVSDILMYNTDKIIIQKIMGLPWVTMYEVANKPNLLFQNFISLPLSAILPACSAAYAKNDQTFLNKVLIQGSRIYLFCVIPVIFIFMVCMKQFLTLWVGKEYVSVTLCAQLFLFTYFVACPFKVFSHMMVSKARVREYATTKIIYAILNIPLSIFFILKIGIIGGILVTVFYWVAVYPLTNAYVFKCESLRMLDLLKAVLPFYLALIPVFFILKVLTNYFPPQGIIMLLFYMGVVCFIYLLCGYKFLLNTDEKMLLRTQRAA